MTEKTESRPAPLEATVGAWTGIGSAIGPVETARATFGEYEYDLKLIEPSAGVPAALQVYTTDHVVNWGQIDRVTAAPPVVADAGADADAASPPPPATPESASLDRGQHHYWDFFVTASELVLVSKTSERLTGCYTGETCNASPVLRIQLSEFNDPGTRDAAQNALKAWFLAFGSGIESYALEMNLMKVIMEHLQEPAGGTVPASVRTQPWFVAALIIIIAVVAVVAVVTAIVMKPFDCLVCNPAPTRHICATLRRFWVATAPFATATSPASCCDANPGICPAPPEPPIVPPPPPPPTPGTPGAGTPGAGTPGAGTPGTGTPGTAGTGGTPGGTGQIDAGP